MVVAIIESDTLRDCRMRTGHEEAEPGSLSSLQIVRCKVRQYGLVWFGVTKHSANCHASSPPLPSIPHLNKPIHSAY